LEISSSLAAVLGFSTNSFTNGSHKSTFTEVTDAYINIPKNSRLTFTLRQWESHQVEIQEPSEYSLNSLVKALTSGISSKRLKIGVILSKSGKILTVKLYQPNARLSFSPPLNNLFGLPEEFVFVNRKTEVYLPDALIESSPAGNTAVPSRT
jgi:hypothetical protein